MTKKSLRPRSLATWPKLAAIRVGRCALWLSICIAWVVWSAVVLLGLALFILPDFLPKRRSKPLTSPAPFLRKLQIPLREGGKLYALNPDGTKIPVSRLEAVTQARAWCDVCFAGFVAERPSDNADG
jgi:hypothetical protein